MHRRNEQEKQLRGGAGENDENSSGSNNEDKGTNYATNDDTNSGKS